LKGGRPEKGSLPATLSDLGITKDQTSQWQQLGRMTDEEFECTIGRNEAPPTTKGLLRVAEEDDGGQNQLPPMKEKEQRRQLRRWREPCADPEPISGGSRAAA
jgi:hypothetical protein